MSKQGADQRRGHRGGPDERRKGEGGDQAGRRQKFLLKAGRGPAVPRQGGHQHGGRGAGDKRQRQRQEQRRATVKPQHRSAEQGADDQLVQLARQHQRQA